MYYGDVRFVPEGDICSAFAVDHHLKFRRLLNRQAGRIGAFEAGQ